jgi:DNA-directed RNA polymerase sigma subunit (sigma70/sigma32)
MASAQRRRRQGPVVCLSPGACWLFNHGGIADIELATDPRSDVEELVEALFDEALVRTYVSMLPDSERTVVCLRFGLAGDAMTIRGVAGYCGRSIGWVHQNERGALERLRSWYKRDGHLP